MNRILARFPRSFLLPWPAVAALLFLAAAGHGRAQLPNETCATATQIPSLPFSTAFDNSASSADGPPGSLQ